MVLPLCLCLYVFIYSRWTLANTEMHLINFKFHCVGTLVKVSVFYDSKERYENLWIVNTIEVIYCTQAFVICVMCCIWRVCLKYKNQTSNANLLEKKEVFKLSLSLSLFFSTPSPFQSQTLPPFLSLSLLNLFSFSLFLAHVYFFSSSLSFLLLLIVSMPAKCLLNGSEMSPCGNIQTPDTYRDIMATNSANM